MCVQVLEGTGPTLDCKMILCISPLHFLGVYRVCLTTLQVYNKTRSGLGQPLVSWTLLPNVTHDHDTLRLATSGFFHWQGLYPLLSKFESIH